MVEYCGTTTYDANCYVTSRRMLSRCSESDESPSVRVEADRCYTYTYDANGNMTGYQQDIYCDGLMDRCVAYANGDASSPQNDADCDGTPD